MSRGLPRIYWCDHLPLAQLVIWPSRRSWFIYVRRDLPPGQAARALRAASKTTGMTWTQKQAALVAVIGLTMPHASLLAFRHVAKVGRAVIVTTTLGATTAVAAVYITQAPAPPASGSFVLLPPAAPAGSTQATHRRRRRHHHARVIVWPTPRPDQASSPTPTPTPVLLPSVDYSPFYSPPESTIGMPSVSSSPDSSVSTSSTVTP